MYDEDSSLVRWARWFARLTVITVVVTVVAGWYYLNRPQRGVWTKTWRENVAAVRDHALSESRRRLAADALERADASIVPELVAELSQGDALGGELAAMALGRLGPKASPAVEELIAALDDPEPLVRERAAVAVGRVCSHPQTVVAALRKITSDSDPEVRGKAFQLLTQQEAAGAQSLIELVGDADADVRRRAVIEIGRMALQIDGSRDALRAARHDADPFVRAEVLAALFNQRAIGPEELGEVIDDRDAIVGSTALNLLQRLGPRAEPLVPQLTARLKTAFEEGDMEIARTLARTLGSVGPAARSATDTLLELAQHPPHPLDVWVRVALQRVGLEAEFELPELLERAEVAGDEIKSLILWDLPRQPRDDPKAPAPRQYEITDADLAHLSGLKNLELLNLNECAIGDTGLAHLAGLTGLKNLSLWRTRVTSAGLAHLANMTQLRSLFLADCPIDDGGLRFLRNLTQLESLSLRGTQITDAGMPDLAGLTRLKKIELGHTAVTDEGLAQLVELPAIERIDLSKGQFTLTRLSQFNQLKELELHDQPITDADLALVARLTHLRELRITRSYVPRSGLPAQEVLRIEQNAGAAITDAGLTRLGTLKELQTLVLTDAHITDAGLKHLAGHTKLRSLWLERCGVTADGIAGLEQSLPGLRVQVPHRRQPFAEYKVVGLEDMRPFQ